MLGGASETGEVDDRERLPKAAPERLRRRRCETRWTALIRGRCWFERRRSGASLLPRDAMVFEVAPTRRRIELVTPPVSVLLVIEEVRKLVAVRTALAKRPAGEDE